jgi:hypothetical protein
VNQDLLPTEKVHYFLKNVHYATADAKVYPGGVPLFIGRGRRGFAGLPAAIIPSGTLLLTTARAPITQLCPIVIPGPRKAPAQIHTPLPM